MYLYLMYICRYVYVHNDVLGNGQCNQAAVTYILRSRLG